MRPTAQLAPERRALRRPGVASQASLGRLGALKLWQGMTVQPAAPSHSSNIQAIAFEPRGTWFATGCMDGSIRLWDTKSGKLKGAMPGWKHGVGMLAISADGRRIATMADLVGDPGTEIVNVWNVRTRKLHRVFKHRSLLDHKHIAFSGDGRYLLVVAQFVDEEYPNGSAQRFVLMAYDIYTGKPRGMVPVTDYTRIYPIAGTKEAWIRKDMHSLHRIQVPSLRTLRTVKFPRREIHSLVQCRGRAVVTAAAKTVQVRDIDKGSWKTLARFSSYYRAVMVSPCADRVAVRDSAIGCSANCKPHQVTLRIVTQTSTGARSVDLKGYKGEVTAYAFSPDGRFLAAGDANQNVALWNADTGKMHSRVGPAVWISALAFSSDNRQLAVGDGSGRVRVYDLTRGRQIVSFAAGKQWVRSVAFTATGRKLIVHSAAKELWDLLPVRKVKPQKMPPAVSRPHADYQVFVHPRKPSEMRDITVGIKTFTNAMFLSHVVHSPVSRLAAYLGDPRQLSPGAGPFHNISIWSVDTGKQVGLLKSHDQGVTELALSRDGLFLASASADGVVKVWRVHYPQ